LAEKHARPLCCIELGNEDVEKFQNWIITENIGVLNVAGPRESSHDGIGQLAESFLVKALACEVGES
jgi:hypothetical protein